MAAKNKLFKFAKFVDDGLAKDAAKVCYDWIYPDGEEGAEVTQETFAREQAGTIRAAINEKRGACSRGMEVVMKGKYYGKKCCSKTHLTIDRMLNGK